MDPVVNEVVPMLYCILAVVGVIGNGLVIFFILRSKDRFKSPTEVYVGNLALADFLFLATLPFWAHDLHTQEWSFGAVACKIMSSISYLNMFGSIFFLVMMAIDRRLAVVQAVASRKNRTVRNAWMRSIIVWAATIPFAVFPVVYRNAIHFNTGGAFVSGTACVWDFPDDHRTTLYLVYNISRMLIGFVIPLGIICFCYLNIILFMKKRNKLFQKNFKELNKVTKMVAAIIACFVLAWLPNQIVSLNHLVSPCVIPYSDDYEYGSGEEYDDEGPVTSNSVLSYTEVPKDYLSTTNSTISTYLFNLNTMISPTTASQLEREYLSCHRRNRMIHMITVCLGFSNSIMNPFIYAFFASTLKNKFTTCASLRGTLRSRGTFRENRPTVTTTAGRYRSTAITSDSNCKGIGRDQTLEYLNGRDVPSKTTSPNVGESRLAEKNKLFLDSPDSQYEEENGQPLAAFVWMGPTVT